MHSAPASFSLPTFVFVISFLWPVMRESVNA